MNSPVSPPGRRREQELIERLADVRAAIEDLGEMLPLVNDVVLRIHAEALAKGAAVVAAHQDKSACGPEIADDLAGLLSAARTLRVPAQDPELGRTPTLQGLRAAKGLIVAALTDALEAAQALGLTPRAVSLPWDSPAEIPRVENEGLLRAITKRLDSVMEKLDILDIAKNDSKVFEQQISLLEFYVGAMRVEINIAKLHLTIGDSTIDFSALGRAVEVMTDLTGDFIATIRAWTGRVSASVSRVAEEVRTRVRRVAVGTRTVAKWLVRKTRFVSPEKTDISPDNENQATTAPSNRLEQTLHRALNEAAKRHHEYATLEHFLFALTFDTDAVDALLYCQVDIELLKKDVVTFLDKDLVGLVKDRLEDPKPTAAFRRVIHRAALQVQRSGRTQITGVDALATLLEERDNHAMYFLEVHNVSQQQVKYFIAQVDYRNLEMSKNPALMMELLKKNFSFVEKIKAISSVTDIEMRRKLAGDVSTPVNVLAMLTADPEAEVRRRVADNPSTPLGVIAMLATDADEEVRRAVAERRKATSLDESEAAHRS